MIRTLPGADVGELGRDVGGGVGGGHQIRGRARRVAAERSEVGRRARGVAHHRVQRRGLTTLDVLLRSGDVDVQVGAAVQRDGRCLPPEPPSATDQLPGSAAPFIATVIVVSDPDSRQPDLTAGVRRGPWFGGDRLTPGRRHRRRPAAPSEETSTWNLRTPGSTATRAGRFVLQHLRARTRRPVRRRPRTVLRAQSGRRPRGRSPSASRPASARSHSSWPGLSERHRLELTAAMCVLRGGQLGIDVGTGQRQRDHAHLVLAQLVEESAGRAHPRAGLVRGGLVVRVAQREQPVGEPEHDLAGVSAEPRACMADLRRRTALLRSWCPGKSLPAARHAPPTRRNVRAVDPARPGGDAGSSPAPPRGRERVAERADRRVHVDRILARGRKHPELGDGRLERVEAPAVGIVGLQAAGHVHHVERIDPAVRGQALVELVEAALVAVGRDPTPRSRRWRLQS